MASTIYTGAASASTAYNPSDVYTLNLSPASITNFSQSGANVVIQTGATALTITGVTLAALATTNFVLLGGGSVTLGDGLAATANDDNGNTITGTAFADVLLGLGGSDTIDGGFGNNLIFGGAGFSDTVDAGDSITAGSGNDTIYGNAGNDTITSGTGTDVIYGGLGNDVISVTPNLGQTATIYGGGAVSDAVDTGIDTITVGASGAAVAGAALIYANGGNDIVNVFSTGNNSVYGGLGNDSITLGAVGTLASGNNFVAGGTNDTDTISIFGNGNNTVYGGTGSTDTTDLADRITVTGNGNNALYGNAGNDTVSALGDGNNSVYGGLGNDSVTLGGNGNNLIFGGTADTDRIEVRGNGNNTIYGGASLNDTADLADFIDVDGTGNNVIYGNGGDDTVLLGFALTVLGQNSIYGGMGADSISVLGGVAPGLNGAAPLAPSLLIQAGSGDDSVNTTGFNFGKTTIYGGNGVNDTTDGGDIIRAGGSADLIYGNGGADVITTGAGADSINGGTGIDRILINGLGNKVIGGNETGEQIIVNTTSAFTAVLNGTDVVVTDGTPRTITFTGGQNSIINIGVQNGLLDDNFVTNTGVAATNLFLANFGATGATLTGLTGADTIYGGTGADTILGAGGNDRIFAGGGNDSINAAVTGTVSILGGDGNDTISMGTFLGGADSVDGGAGIDVLNFTDAGGGLTTDLDSVTNIETIVLGDAPTSVITLNSLVAAGASLTVDGAAVTTAANGITFNGGNETDGTFNITGGAGNDALTGGALTDTINGGAGNDVITGNGGQDIINLGTGNDQVVFGSAFTAGNASADTITGLEFGAPNDTYDIGFNVFNGGTGPTANLVAVAPVAVANGGTATPNGVLFTFSGVGDKLAAGTTIATAVANAVTALTSGTDFSSGGNIVTNDSLLLVLDDGTNSFVFHYLADATPATTTAADIELIGVVNGQLANQVATGDFV